MGSGKWSPNTYQQRAVQRQSSGQDVFNYSRNASGVHPSLNPYGLEVRESRDSDEHPNSNAIIVGLDVSGSMGAVVRAIHKDLPNLFKLLLDREYVPHPQIMFSAFSNGGCDPVPVQVGQFESDNRMDENLENMILGGRLAGGCDIRESAELILYLAARHTSIDCWEKRQKKGYIFLITDEMAYENIKANEINTIFASGLKGDIPLQNIVQEVSEQYHIFILIPTQTQSGKNPQVREFYRAYFNPQHVILLENSDDVSETIALILGLMERTISLEDGLHHLRQTGANDVTINGLSKSLAMLDGGAVKGAGGLAHLDDDNSNGGGARRL